jgi:hypothetical protein
VMVPVSSHLVSFFSFFFYSSSSSSTTTATTATTTTTDIADTPCPCGCCVQR